MFLRLLLQFLNISISIIENLLKFSPTSVQNYMSQGTIARSRKKQLENENRKKINKNIDKYYDEGTLDVELSRAMVAEKDLEMIHHKHFRKYEAEKVI